MRVKDFLGVLCSSTGHLMVVCPDNLGLQLLLTKSLQAMGQSQRDCLFLSGADLTIEKARRLTESLARTPLESDYHLVVLFKAAQVPTYSVAALLKLMEDSKKVRFLIQTSTRLKKLETVASRTVEVSLPFLSKKMVLGNMQALNMDSRKVDTLDLYDGTLEGTINRLQMRDSFFSVINKVERGELSLFVQEGNLKFLGFRDVMSLFTTEEEDRFLARKDNEVRRGLILYLVNGRKSFDKR